MTILKLLSLTFFVLIAFSIAKDLGSKRAQQKAIIDSLKFRVVDGRTHSTSEELVDFVNKKQHFWKAEVHSRFSGYSEHTRTGMMGVQNIRLPIEAKKRLSATRNLNLTIPDSFDAREWWPECESIGRIGDQSSCGSCWAFGAAEAITDRICIATKGAMKFRISADDLLACCRNCGDGCDGGYPIKAWDFWVSEGIVTGGDYGSNDTCLPYPFPECSTKSAGKTDECKHGSIRTPQCKKQCQSDYNYQYKKDKHFGLSSYGIAEDVESIQKELMTYGPVEVSFEVYEDFMHYKEGVYVHTTGELVGGHAVKLIGWGVENKLPYWLLMNSWNTDWGNKGFFKIARGVNECGVESGVVAGIPKTA